MSDEKIIDFNTYKNQKEISQPVTQTTPTLVPQAYMYEVHFFGGDYEAEGDFVEPEPVVATGYLKFGPQFIAICEGLDNESPVVFAAATQTVKYVKKIDATDGSVQGTLGL